MAVNAQTLCYAARTLFRSPLIRRGNGRAQLIAVQGIRSASGRHQHDHDDNTEAIRQNYEARVDLAAAYRGINDYGLSEGVCNHLSFNAPARSGTGRVMLLIPYGLHWKEVTASRLLGIDFDTGEVLEGDGEPETSASEIHRAVHKARPDIRCCLHTHPPYTTALSLLKEPYLRLVHQNAMRFYNNISYDNAYDGYATSGHEGPRLANALGKKGVLMMGGHGVAVVSRSISIAFDETYYLERAAMFQILAMSTGKELKEIPEELAAKMRAELDTYDQKYSDAHFNSIKRLLANKSPDYTA